MGRGRGPSSRIPAGKLVSAAGEAATARLVRRIQRLTARFEGGRIFYVPHKLEPGKVVADSQGRQYRVMPSGALRRC